MRKNKVNFTAAPEVLERLAEVGITQKRFCSSYMGYTGPKSRHFPTSKNLAEHLYPDVTEHYNALIESALETAKKSLGKNKVVNFFKKCSVLCKNFKKADKWDTQFHEHFPGRDKNGNLQYAMFKGKVVSANHISNYIYSEMLYHLGFKKWMAIGAAKIYSQGVTNVFFDKTIPSLKALAYRDTPQDQQTIRAAYEEFLQGKPILG